MSTMFVLASVRKWNEAFEYKNPMPIPPVHFDVRSIGFLEVYKTKEDLLEDYPDVPEDQIWEITEKTTY